MKPLLPLGLIAAISLLFAQIVPLQAQEPRGSALRLVDPAFQEHFNSDVSRSPRFRVDRPVWRRRDFSRPIVEVPPAPLQETRVEEVVASPHPTATPVVTSIPTLNPAPSVTPVPTPLTPDPTPPEVKRPPLLPVPPPNPAPEIAPPPREAPAAFLIGPPDLQRIARAKPRIEVWRSGSIKPQRLAPHEGPKRPAFVLGTEPVTIVLRFPPFLAGKSVTFMPGDGIALHPPQSFARIQSSGELVLTVELDSTQRGGGIVFVVEGVTTGLRLVRASLARVEAEEDASAEESP